METRVVGTTMPVLEVGLEPGESIVAEAGEMSWMTPNVELCTTTAAAGSGAEQHLRQVVAQPCPREDFS